MSKIIVDLEHTLSNASHRLWMLKGKNLPESLSKYYDETFQKAFKKDTINSDVKSFIISLKNNGAEIIILTAKSNFYRKDVLDWLDKKEVSYDKLIMKPIESGLGDLEFKKEVLISIKDTNIISFALNDVGKECAMFEKLGIPCLRVIQK